MVVCPTSVPRLCRYPSMSMGHQPFSRLCWRIFSAVSGGVLWTMWGILSLGLSPSSPLSRYRFLESKDIKGVSFVGSTPVARYVYAKATSTGKRAQCQGGAKNFLVVMPDAPLDKIMPTIMNSVYGCAGQRCLAGTNIVAVGDIYEPLKQKLVEAAKSIKVGNGRGGR